MYRDCFLRVNFYYLILVIQLNPCGEDLSVVCCAPFYFIQHKALHLKRLGRTWSVHWELDKRTIQQKLYSEAAYTCLANSSNLLRNTKLRALRWRRRRWRRRAAASRTSTREPRPGLPGTSGGSITSLMPSPSPQAGAYFKCHTVRAQLKVILVRDPDGANLSTYTKYYHINWTRCILNSKYQNHTTNIKAISNIWSAKISKKIHLSLGIT